MSWMVFPGKSFKTMKLGLKLEHKKEKLASVPTFLGRMLRYSLFAFLMIAVSMTIGTIGYRYYGFLEWVDSFYMAAMILTGMGPTAVMESTSAKIFSSVYGLYSGVAFLSCCAVIFSPVIHRLLHILHLESGKSDD